MPTYRITGPDGQMYDVTPPEGTNPSESEILAQVQVQAAKPAASATGGWPEALSLMGGGVRYEPAPRSDGIGIDIKEVPAPHGPLDMLSLLGTGGGALLSKGAAPALQLGSRLLGSILGGEAGGQLQGAPPGSGSLVGGLGAAAGELGGALWKFLSNVGPTAKANINEAQMRGLGDVIETVNPALGQAVVSARGRLSPLLKGGRTAAAIQETALGQGGKRALGDAFEQGMLDTTLAAEGQGIVSKALETAWRRLPNGLGPTGEIVDDLAYKTWTDLAPSPAGTFTASQAEGLLARLGDAAFKGEAASPIARGIGGIELRKLYEQATQETLSGLSGAAGPIMGQTRREFAGGNALMDAAREAQAFTGLPNRIQGNMPAIQKYVSDNRAELQTKLGDEGYRALVDAVYAGGQIGTRDIPTPGSGETLNALRQVYGRGQGGAPQIVGSAVRTLAPNLGGQTTGRGFYRIDPNTQALMDYLGIQAMDKAREQGISLR